MHFTPTKKVLALCLLYSLLSVISFAATSKPQQYIFLCGKGESKYVDVFSLDLKGSVTLLSTLNLGPYSKTFIDADKFIFSKTGKYLFIHDGNYSVGLFFAIEPGPKFHFIKEITGGCAGGGFTEDEEYFFTTSGSILAPPNPKLCIFKTNNGAFDLLKQQDVSSTATIRRPILCDDSRNLVYGSAYSGDLWSPQALVVYQFDRSLLALDLKQYMRGDNKVLDGAAMDPAKKKLFNASQEQVIECYTRRDDGLWNPPRTFWRSDIWKHSCAWDAKILPDGMHAVASIESTQDTNVGFTLLSVAEDGEIGFVSILNRKESTDLAMSPDGKFFVGVYNFGSVLGVMRINWQTMMLEEVNTILHKDSYALPIAFMPSFYPIAEANSNWERYK